MQPPEFNVGVLRPVEVYKEAWAMMKADFWLSFAVVLLGMIVGSLVPLIIVGPMMCGIYVCLLDKVDGRPIVFEKLFKGFDYFLPGFIVALVIMLPLVAFLFAVYIPMIGIAMAGTAIDEDMLLPIIGGIIIVEVVIGVIMTLLHSLIIFAFPLIVDRGLGGLDAIKLSARSVWANKSGVAGLFGVGFLVCIVGYLAFCVGIYLALPVIIMSTAVAYRKVFPPLVEVRFEPPPPNAYLGL